MNQKTINKYSTFLLKGLLLLFMAGVFAGCKSHKKQILTDDIYIGETIETPKKKKKEKKSNSIGEKVAKESLTWIGTPYGFGHSEKGISTDCSGMVLVIYEKVADIKLPRNSAQQADFCHDLKEKDIEPGDLVFFATGKDKKKVSHVGIMLDRENFVHASGSKGVIKSDMQTPYYRRTFIKYGRVPR